MIIKKTFARVVDGVVIELLEAVELPEFYPTIADQWLEVAPGQIEQGYIRQEDGGFLPPAS